MFDKNINYIVSGLTRSGTSMLMQILDAGNVEIAFDDKRPPDKYNTNGYYELEGGKIINKLIDKTFPLNKHKGKFIKITSYGLKYLPIKNYKIIYCERNIEEILNSMERMMNKKDNNREITKKAFIKLNNTTKSLIENRDDMDCLFVDYNDILSNPIENITRICSFLNLPNISNKMAVVVKAKSL